MVYYHVFTRILQINTVCQVFVVNFFLRINWEQFLVIKIETKVVDIGRKGHKEDAVLVT